MLADVVEICFCEIKRKEPRSERRRHIELYRRGVSEHVTQRFAHKTNLWH